MSEQDDEQDIESYKQLLQFYTIMRNATLHCDYYHVDKELMNKQLQIIMEQSTGINNYQFPANFVKLRNGERGWSASSLRHLQMMAPLSDIAGCSALHLAVAQQNSTIVNALLKHGIDFTLQNQEGSTALHDCLYHVNQYYYKHQWQSKYKSDIIDSILSAHVERDISKNPYDRDGISHFHIGCMVGHSESVGYFLSCPDGHQLVNADVSSYSPLHLAVAYGSREVAEILMRHGAQVNRRDENEMTVMDLLLLRNIAIVDWIADLIHIPYNNNNAYLHYYAVIQLQSYLDDNKRTMRSLLSCIDSFDDSTGLLYLHLASASGDISLIEKSLKLVDDINVRVNVNSAFWGGYTALHFAAHFDVETLKLLLSHGADIEAKDDTGLTPFDVCLERYKVHDLVEILNCHPVWNDILLTDGRTKLVDMLEAMSDCTMLDAFLNDNAGLRVPNDSPLWPGYTALHLALNLSETIKIVEEPIDEVKENFLKMERDYIQRIEMCLKHDIDVTIQDAYGTSSLHLAYKLQKAKVVDTILREHHHQVDNPIDTDGLSHLYIACAFEYPLVVEKILENAKNLEKIIEQPILSTFQWRRNQRYFARRNREEIEFHVDVGSTPLQIADSRSSESKSVRILLEHGAKSQTRIKLTENCDEISWPVGCVPLYTMIRRKSISQDNRSMIAKLPQDCSSSSNNPIDNDGVSRFHRSCVAVDLEAMTEFLKSGVDVNQTVALYSYEFSGFSPLHLVLHRDSKIDNDLRVKAIDLLVRYGVDVQARDLFGNTAFHSAVLCCAPKVQLFRKIFSIGTDIKQKNILGEEPLGTLLSSKKFEAEEVEFFLRHGCHLNIYEPKTTEGCMRGFFSRNQYLYKVFKKMIRLPGIDYIDDSGRNAIHNLVSWQYPHNIHYREPVLLLMEGGCDVDHRDQFGRTPLHLAVEYENYKAVDGLLTAGADINITDATGNSAFSIASPVDFHYEHNTMLQSMVMHLRKLQLVGLYVSELNAKILADRPIECPLDQARFERAKADLKKMKDTTITSTSVTLYDFFSETGVLAAFPYMPLQEQQAINAYFKYSKRHHFKQLRYLLIIQYQKALRRWNLLEPANVALNILVGILLPDKCLRCVMRCLTNAELANLIKCTKL